jgi:hypothetical protein
MRMSRSQGTASQLWAIFATPAVISVMAGARRRRCAQLSEEARFLACRRLDLTDGPQTMQRVAVIYHHVR